jgi:leucyl-tRNA synthetase
MNGRRMPIYTANFALMEYGTGAVMSVPAHDQRDFDFARKYDLAGIVVVVQPEGDVLDGTPWTPPIPAEGHHGQLRAFDGMDNREAMEAIAVFWRKWAGAKRRSASGCGTGAFPGSATGARPSP